jgi:hypothetical protein
MDELLKTILTALLSGAVISAILGLVFKRRTETITAEIKNQFEMNLLRRKTGQQWKEKALIELYGPLNYHFTRTKKALSRYTDKNLYLEVNVFKDSNQKIRDLLLEKSYLIYPELTGDAEELITHYDVWLEQYHKLRVNPDAAEVAATFVFVQDLGFPFPRAAEEIFKQKYRELWNDVYKS